MMKYSWVRTPTPCRMAGCVISIRLMIHAPVHLLTYTIGSGHKNRQYPKRLKIERKLLSTAYLKSYTDFRLPPTCMTLNDLWARFRVIDSLNAAKMRKYSLVITPTPCRVSGYIISIRPTYSAPIHLLTYTVGSGRIKPAISPKRLKIERKLLLMGRPI